MRGVKDLRGKDVDVKRGGIDFGGNEGLFREPAVGGSVGPGQCGRVKIRSAAGPLLGGRHRRP